MRTAARKDANQKEIVKGLRRIGASVEVINKKGFTDLVVGWRKVNYLMEVKTDEGNLTEDQEKWHAEWKGQKAIVRNLGQAYAVIGVRVTGL
jgi:hypothetical protein